MNRNRKGQRKSSKVKGYLTNLDSNFSWRHPEKPVPIENSCRQITNYSKLSLLQKGKIRSHFLPLVISFIVAHLQLFRTVFSDYFQHKLKFGCNSHFKARKRFFVNPDRAWVSSLTPSSLINLL